MNGAEKKQVSWKPYLGQSAGLGGSWDSVTMMVADFQSSVDGECQYL